MNKRENKAELVDKYGYQVYVFIDYNRKKVGMTFNYHLLQLYFLKHEQSFKTIKQGNVLYDKLKDTNSDILRQLMIKVVRKFKISKELEMINNEIAVLLE